MKEISLSSIIAKTITTQHCHQNFHIPRLVLMLLVDFSFFKVFKNLSWQRVLYDRGPRKETVNS